MTHRASSPARAARALRGSLVQHLVGAASTVLTYFLARALRGRVDGVIAALLVTLAGMLIIAEDYILAEALFTSILLGFALVVSRALRRADVPATRPGSIALAPPRADALRRLARVPGSRRGRTESRRRVAEARA